MLRRVVLPNLLVGAVYFAAGKLGLWVPFTSGNVSPVWPPAGIALAAVVLFGYRVLPGIAAGAFLVNLFSPIPAAAAAGMACGNTLSAAAARFLWDKLRLEPAFARLRDVLGLFVTASAAPLVAAIIGAGSLSAFQVRAWSSFWEAGFVWWLGDAMGMLLLAPLVLSLPSLSTQRERLLELGALFASLWLVTVVVFNDRLGLTQFGLVLALAVFPFVVWGAIRFGAAGSALSSALVAAISIYYTARQQGPFTQREALENVVLLQFFVAVISATGLILAAVVQERRRAVDELDRDRKLRESEEKFRAVAETAATAIYIHDGTRLLYVNPAAEKMTGYSRAELFERDMWHMVHPEDLERVRQNAAARFRGEGPPHRYEYRIVAKDGGLRWLDFGGSMIDFGGKRCILATALDITDRKLAEEALRLSDKLATVGRMAASIAHEINNPLESVTNLLYLIRTHAALSEEVRPLVDLAQSEMERVAHVARQTLAFYRDPSSPAETRLSMLLDGVLRLYAAKLNAAQIAVETRYETERSVPVIAGELRQVFSNLLLNAIDAMPEGGAIAVHVYQTRAWRGAGGAGMAVVLRDTGSGIARAHLRTIFDPFFTTKGARGTGLGLWVSKGIVEKHGGAITVRSSTLPGRSGTCFRIFLPFRTASSAHAGGLGELTVA
jgi:PAS domain S-box-containing protein